MSWQSPSLATAAQPLLPIRHDRRGPALVAEDLDGDRKDDLLIGGSVLDSAMLVQTGDASVRALRVSSAGASPTLVNDGPMLVVRPVEGGPRQWLITRGGVSEPAGTPAYQPTLWQIGANGAAEDASALLPPLPLSVGAVVAADFNRDGTVGLTDAIDVLKAVVGLTAPSPTCFNTASARS